MYENGKISIDLINYKATDENKHFIDYEVLKQLKMNKNCFKIDKEIKKYSEIQNYQSMVNYTNNLLSNYDFYTKTEFRIMKND